MLDRIDGTVEGRDVGNIAGSEEVGIWEEEGKSNMSFINAVAGKGGDGRCCVGVKLGLGEADGARVCGWSGESGNGRSKGLGKGVEGAIMFSLVDVLTVS